MNYSTQNTTYFYSVITVTGAINHLWTGDHLRQKFLFKKDIHLQLSTLIGQLMKKATYTLTVQQARRFNSHFSRE